MSIGKKNNMTKRMTYFAVLGKNDVIIEMNSVIARKEKASMNDLHNMSDEELEKICFVNADDQYITNTVKKAKEQYKDGKYITIIKNGIDVETGNIV